MQNSIDEEIRKKTHIFNTFFFTRLQEKKKDDKVKIGEYPAVVYNRVKNWLKNVDIFSKDYLVIPVNRSHHWFLIIVCNAKNVLSVQSDDVVNLTDGDLTKEKM